MDVDEPYSTSPAFQEPSPSTRAAMKPSAHASEQYSTTTANLTARIALHAYSSNPQNWHSWLGAHIPLADRAILDVGAGTGDLWRRTDPSPARSLALVDSSPAMCAALADLAAADNVSVHQADAAHLPFPNASFDSLVAAHVLHHADDPPAALREFARVLRLGGALVVAVPASAGLAPELADLLRAARRPEHPGLPRGAGVGGDGGFDAATAPALVERGFQDVVLDEFVADLEVPEAGPVVAYLRSLGPAGGEWSEAQERAVRERVEEKVRAEGCFRVKKRVVLITALRGVI